MVERSWPLAARASRAEAQGICSRSPFAVRRPVPYGKSNPQLCCESSVFRQQSAVNRKDMAASIRFPLRSAVNEVQFAANRGRFFFERFNFLMSARTAILHGSERVLKVVADRAIWWFIIRCPEIWSRDQTARGSPRCGLLHSSSRSCAVHRRSAHTSDAVVCVIPVAVRRRCRANTSSRETATPAI